ncbi:MAG: hypothetical protein H7836_16850 [Magnetococcus sp. YQC-3]
MIPNFVAKNSAEFNEKAKYIDNLLVKIEVYNDNVEPVNITYLGNLDLYSQLYSSYEEISRIAQESPKAYK